MYIVPLNSFPSPFPSLPPPTLGPFPFLYVFAVHVYIPCLELVRICNTSHFIFYPLWSSRAGGKGKEIFTFMFLPKHQTNW